MPLQCSQVLLSIPTIISLEHALAVDEMKYIANVTKKWLVELVSHGYMVIKDSTTIH